jgi:hypothetical protein
MNRPDISSLVVQRASERLRQERETFEQRKKHENQWFVLRLVMGFSSIVLLAAVIIICSVILLGTKQYSDNIVNAAGIALFTDVLGLLISVWKIVLNTDSITQLKPVTAIEDSFFSDENTETTQVESLTQEDNSIAPQSPKLPES